MGCQRKAEGLQAVMPELPEVETTLRGIEPLMVGSVLESVDVRVEKLRFPMPPELSDLHDVKIIGGRRRSKYILLDLENGQTIMVHLGMSGRLVLNRPPAKHDHVIFRMASGDHVTLNDPRKFGLVDLYKTADEAEHRLLKNLGPEPLTDAFNAAYLYGALCKRSTAIKPTLMDAKVVVGVGNIYANEALFRAKIHPAKPANKLTKKQVEVLVPEIKTVLKEAIEAGGSSLRDYQHSDGKLGYFQFNFLVYGREGQPCRVCGTPIQKITLAQRSTFFCPKCQPKR